MQQKIRAREPEMVQLAIDCCPREADGLISHCWCHHGEVERGERELGRYNEFQIGSLRELSEKLARKHRDARRRLVRPSGHQTVIRHKVLIPISATKRESSAKRVHTLSDLTE